MKPNDGSDAGTGGRPRRGRNCLTADGGEAFSAADGRVSSASYYALNGTYLQGSGIDGEGRGSGAPLPAEP